jgi:hypothetical protein
MAEEKNKENSLLVAVQSGIMSAQNIEEAQRYIQIAFASNLIKGVQKLSETINLVDDLQSKIVNKLVNKLEEDIEVLDTDKLLEYASKINSMIVQSVETQRKVAQGKELLSSYPTLSDEEKEVVKMMKALETENDKVLFLKTLKQVLSNKDKKDDDFENED